jgi:peroxiredoxin Q/BCP
VTRDLRKNSDTERAIPVATSAALQVGDPAPDFRLAAANGEMVSLADFRGRANVVLFFYPTDHSPVCSAEACSFRDSYDDFRKAGAQVIGISADSPQSHSRFSLSLKLPYVLLSDPDGAVRASYRVPKTLGLFPGRTTYVIDKQGVIRHIFSSQFLPSKHVSDALLALKVLKRV